MGTRSTTKIYENGELLLALYKQYDGYLEGWGKDLKEFIDKCDLVNGLSVDRSEENNNKRIVCNGMGDFALLLIKEFKHESGGLYATIEEDEQAYNYKIEFFDAKEGEKECRIVLSCEDDDEEEFKHEWRYPSRYAIFEKAKEKSNEEAEEKPVEKYEYDLDITHEGVKINNTLIDEDVFQHELVDYSVREREDQIDHLISWIAECSKESDRFLMKEDLEYLLKLKDEYILSSIMTNEYIAKSDNLEDFNKVCGYIIETNIRLKYSKKIGRDWKNYEVGLVPFNEIPVSFMEEIVKEDS